MQDTGAGYELGTVKAWKEERGMGFISPASGGEDVFVHRSNLVDAQALVEGSQVMFERGWDQMKGKPICKSVMGASIAGLNDTQAGNAMQTAPQAVPPPAMPRKVAPRPHLVQSNGMTGMGGGGGGAVAAVVPPPSWAPGGNSPAPVSLQAGSQTGIVKAWMVHRGMGFISPSTGDADLFVHCSNLIDCQALTPGQSVTFDSNWDVQKNKPIAKNVRAADSNAGTSMQTWEGTPSGVMDAADQAALQALSGGSSAPGAMSGTAPAGFGDEAVITDWFADVGATGPADSGSTPAMPDMSVFDAFSASVSETGIGQATPGTEQSSAGPEQSLQMSQLAAGLSRAGLVKVWFEEKSYGFLTPNDGGTDVFVHRSALKSCAMLFQGSTVAFDTKWDPNSGKEIATACVCTSNSQGGAGMKSGTVKAWFEERGFGFIQADDGSGDAFVHRAALSDGSSLMQGASIWYEAQWNDIKKKNTATKVVGAVGALGAPGSAGVGGAPGSAGWSYGADPMAGAAEAPPSDNLYVQGLPVDMPEEMVKTIFGSYGDVGSVKVSPSGKTDAALVRMADVSQAQWLVDNLNGNVPVGLSSPIQVSFAKSRTSSFGKAAGKGSDNRFSPYGAPQTVPPPPGGVPASWMSLGSPQQAAAQPAATPGERTTGIVKVWMEHRGMGFIAPAAGGDDLFVHRSYLADGQSLMPGATVTYESSWDMQKNKAIAKLVQGAVAAPAAQVVVPPPPAGGPPAMAMMQDLGAAAPVAVPPPPAGGPPAMAVTPESAPVAVPPPPAGGPPAMAMAPESGAESGGGQALGGTPEEYGGGQAYGGTPAPEMVPPTAMPPTVMPPSVVPPPPSAPEGAEAAMNLT